MKTIILDCADIPDKTAFHRMLAEKLAFPEWYGHNLDALMDCLTDLDTTQLVCTHWSCLGDWAAAFAETFADAAAENPYFQFIIQ